MATCHLCGHETGQPFCERCGAAIKSNVAAESPPFAGPLSTNVGFNSRHQGEGAHGTARSNLSASVNGASDSVSQPGSGHGRSKLVIPSVLAGVLAVVVAFAISAMSRPQATGPESAKVASAGSASVQPTQSSGAQPAQSSVPEPTPAVLSAGWIEVFDSLNKNDFTFEQAVAQATALAGPGRPVAVIDSSATNGLNPGYWALVAGPFGSKAQANAICASYGRAVGDTCYPRQVTG